MGKCCCVITINNIVIYVISLKLKYIIITVKMTLISVEGKNSRQGRVPETEKLGHRLEARETGVIERFSPRAH